MTLGIGQAHHGRINGNASFFLGTLVPGFGQVIGPALQRFKIVVLALEGRHHIVNEFGIGFPVGNIQGFHKGLGGFFNLLFGRYGGVVFAGGLVFILVFVVTGDVGLVLIILLATSQRKHQNNSQQSGNREKLFHNDIC